MIKNIIGFIKFFSNKEEREKTINELRELQKNERRNKLMMLKMFAESDFDLGKDSRVELNGVSFTKKGAKKFVNENHHLFWEVR